MYEDIKLANDDVLSIYELIILRMIKLLEQYEIHSIEHIQMLYVENDSF